MIEWDKNKSEFIEKLSRVDHFFNEIFRVDKDGVIIQGNERKTLEHLRIKNKTILNKLQS